jgi:hypothetical protein
MISAIQTTQLGKVIYEYLLSDGRRQYGLLESVRMVLEGEGIAEIKGKLVDFENHVLSLKNEGRNRLIINIQPFAAVTGCWNGPDVIFDFDDGRMEASLVHDLIWEFIQAICVTLNLRERDIKKWSNKLFAVIWQAYAADKGIIGKGAKIKSRIAATFTHPAIAVIWKQIKRLFLLFVIVLIQGCGGGCINIPDDWNVVEKDKVKWERVENKEVDE